jgi:hypothetical protein
LIGIKKIKIALLLLTIFTTIQVTVYNKQVTPASSEVIENLALTAWTNGVAFNEGMTAIFSVDFATLYSSNIFITIDDLDGNYYQSMTIIDPLNAPDPRDFFFTASASDQAGIHRFKVTCSQGIYTEEQYLSILIHPEQFGAEPVTGLTTTGSLTVNYEAEPTHNLANNGQHLTLNTSLYRPEGIWMAIHDIDGLMYFREDVGGENRFYYPISMPETVIFVLGTPFDFRVPTNWSIGRHELVAVFTGSEYCDLETASSTPITIDVAAEFGVVLESSASSVERNN